MVGQLIIALKIDYVSTFQDLPLDVVGTVPVANPQSRYWTVQLEATTKANLAMKSIAPQRS